MQVHARQKVYRKEGLLPLNPVTNRQFLTLLYAVKRFNKAVVPNKHDTNIHCNNMSGDIEHKGNVMT